MRVFTGVFPPEPIAADIHAAVAEAGSEIRTRWIPVSNLHVTLAFLGEVPASSLEIAERSLREAAATLSPFTVRLGGFGAFPNLRRARVAFVGVRAGSESLARLSETFLQALPRTLRPDERRPFHAHLTLTRLRQPPSEDMLEGLVRALEPLEWRFDVQAARLVESVLAPEGARYETRALAPLGFGVGS